MMGLDALGPLLVVLALALMSVSPLQMTLSRAKPERSQMSPRWHDAFPPPLPAPELDRLAEDADRALADDPLIHATAEIAETYDKA